MRGWEWMRFPLDCLDLSIHEGRCLMSENLSPACLIVLRLLKEFQIDGRRPVIPSRKHVVAYMARYPDLSVEQAIKRLSWIGPFRSSDHPFLKGGIRFDPVPEFLIAVEFSPVGLVRDGDTQGVRKVRYLESTDPLIPDPDRLEATLRELRVTWPYRVGETIFDYVRRVRKV